MIYSMLLTALAQTFGSTGYVEKSLPIIEMLAKDSMFYVRKEVAVSLGSLAATAPLSIILERLIPLYSDLSIDKIWHVRRACVFILPLLCEAMPDNLKEKTAIDSINLFKRDDSKSVHNALADIIGELISKFLPIDWKETGQPGHVPEELLHFFLSLGKPAISNSNHTFKSESEFLYSCAYNFPAVVLTAGVGYWGSHLKSTYLALAKDYQLKVRCTLACSLHEIARVIGPERTKSDLVHIFALYLMDLDSVKQGVLEHISEFLSILDPDTRNEYIPILAEVWDGVMNNWHLREILTIQLQDMARLFDASRVTEHILPLAIRACHDEYAAVREACVDIFPVILDIVKRAVDESGEEASIMQRGNDKQQQALIMLNHVIERLEELVHSPSYRTRLVFAQICRCLLEAGISPVDFASFFLPRVSLLARDPVVNVRIAISRMMLTMISIDGYMKELESAPFDDTLEDITPHQMIQDILYYLSTDSDSDVRSFIVEHVPLEMLRNLKVAQIETPEKDDIALDIDSLSLPPDLPAHFILPFGKSLEDPVLEEMKEMPHSIGKEGDSDDVASVESPMDIVDENQFDEENIDTSDQKYTKDNELAEHSSLVIEQKDYDGDLIMAIDDSLFEGTGFEESQQASSTTSKEPRRLDSSPVDKA
ncbi:armadillo-type protein [Choanephora cucurbitarum]|nr:armadillo-type protein [Choanephora cucurbitarum]